MDILSAFITPIVEIVFVPVKKQLGYVFSWRKYARDMHAKMRELDAARVSIEEHMNQNRRNYLHVPTQVTGWLQEAENVKASVENLPIDVGSCFNLKSRHNLGRNASKIIKEIDTVLREHSLITWTDHPIPLGKVDSMKASTSTTSSDYNDFQSREHIFMEALKALGPNHKSHMVALWGMGGVGKTTIMKNLKKVVAQKKLFEYIVQADIGEKTDPIAIQESVAEYLHVELRGSSKPARADKLRKGFEAKSDGGKNKFLVILDDVWQSVDLEDIGLSRFPNQGVDFKVLLTSRDRGVCTMMGVEANSVFKVRPLMEAEAHILFRQFLETFDDLDSTVHKIGNDIVTKCCGLPIAIKTMACTLRGKSRDTWNDALSRLEHHDIKTVAPTIFKTSYDNLQDEESEATFLLCGLFPGDLNIPTEDLVRYGWGLNLFKGVYTISQARTRLNTCIERLLHTNLLIESDYVGCVKMHDLVRDFVWNMFSKLEHASIVNHGSNPAGWPENNDMSAFCKRISLTCEGMSEFPRDLNFPNLSFLKLMHGSERLRFPQDFYGEMKRLQVISYNQMEYTLLPSLPQYSTNLRVLHLHECSLTFDISSIGNLLNLEVLSIVNSDIESLPSTIGNLTKLRLLDLTDHDGVCIHNGVLKNLVKLEELYLRVSDHEYRNAIKFTDDSWKEMAQRSKTLSALEFEFYENNAQLQNMSFEKLERFRISVGRYLDRDNKGLKMHSFENTLQLVTDKGDLLESRMNELFGKTEVLHLSVNDMNDLEDVDVKSSVSPQSSSFYNLRILVVSKCAQLRYLFTIDVAKALSKLECLKVSSCPIMKELIHTESGRKETITFPKLKVLSLFWLDDLSGLCHNVNIIELPHLISLHLGGIPKFTSIYPKNKLATSCFMNEEVVIPRLEELHIYYMFDLKEIWPIEFCMSEEVNASSLRQIVVSDCNNLVNLFPCNPMSLLHQLEDLQVSNCESIEALFNIDMDVVVGESGVSSLKRVEVHNLGKLREVWRIKNADNLCPLIRGFEAVESIHIGRCKRFRATNIDLGPRLEISVNDCGERGRNNGSVESSQEGEINILSNKVTSQIADSISKVVFRSCDIHSLHNLRKLDLWSCEEMDVVFEIESPRNGELTTNQDNQQRLLPYLEELDIRDMNSITHVWKCNWNTFFTLRKQQLDSPYHNLTTIRVYRCKNIKYLFSPLMAKLLSNLKKVKITDCDGIEEVVSHRDDEDEKKTTSTSTQTSTTLFPHLDSLILRSLENLNCIGGGNNDTTFNNTTATTIFPDQSMFSQVVGVSWSLCQYPKEIEISLCHALSSVIPSNALGKILKLQVLKISYCSSMKEVFETQGINNSSNYVDEGTPPIPRQIDDVKHHVLKLPNLKILKIDGCDLVEHVFPFSTLESLRQLEELMIKDCDAMKVIVKEECGGEQTATSEVVVFGRLRSIKLINLPDLVGFYRGMNEFRWPSLHKVKIINCPQMMVFTPGGSRAPQLKFVETILGKHSPECGFNFHATNISQLQTRPPSLGHTTLCPATTSEGIPWSFHNLIESQVKFNAYVETIIPSSELLQLQKLEKIHLRDNTWVELVFDALKGTDSAFDESETVIKLPNLREVELYRLAHLRYIWKHSPWTTFEFPNLTRVYIGDCKTLAHAFTSSMLGCLLNLQELHIIDCIRMEEVIVKDKNVVVEVEEESDGKMNEIMLPCLKSLKLDQLPCLKGFCLGKENFSFPSMDILSIKKCPSIMIFTKGSFVTPVLGEIETSFGLFDVGEDDINSFIKKKQEEFKRDPMSSKY